MFLPKHRSPIVKKNQNKSQQCWPSCHERNTILSIQVLFCRKCDWYNGTKWRLWSWYLSPHNSGFNNKDSKLFFAKLIIESKSAGTHVAVAKCTSGMKRKPRTLLLSCHYWKRAMESSHQYLTLLASSPKLLLQSMNLIMKISIWHKAIHIISLP